MRSQLTRTLTAVLGAGLLVALSACAPTSEDTSLDTGAPEITMEDWRQGIDDCMLDAGFDLVAMSESTVPSITSEEESADFDKAYTGCIGEVGEAPVDESILSEDDMFESQLVFAGCMRDAGYDYPDPVKGSGGMSEAFGPEVDPEVIDSCWTKGQEAIK